MPTMLYKCPGPHEIHGGHFDYVIVDESAIHKTLADGWFRSTPEAKAAHEAALAAAVAPPADDEPPTRAELEQQAAKLGLKFDGRTSDRKLGAMVAAAMGA